MKQMLVLAGWAIALLALVGCQNANRQGNAIEVIVEGGGEFPQFLVGTWKADEGDWEIVFGPNGTISSAIITIGGVRMKPGEITTVPMIRGGKGVYEPGQWLVHYTPANRELMVEISLKNFHAQVGNDVLEGKGTDILIGKVSEDGKVWLVDWTSFPDYMAHTKEYPEFRMTEDPNYGITSSMTFKKVQIK